MHRLTDTRSEAQQSARGAVAQGVTTGLGVGVAMPHQVPITRMEGSQGGTTKPPTCPPPPPLPSFPCTTHTRSTLCLAYPSGIKGSVRAKPGGVRVCKRQQQQQQLDCS